MAHRLSARLSRMKRRFTDRGLPKAVCMLDSSSWHAVCPTGMRHDTSEALMRQVVTTICEHRRKQVCILNPEDSDGIFGLGPSPEVHSRCFGGWAPFLEQCNIDHDSAAVMHPLGYVQPAPTTQRHKSQMHAQHMLDAWALFASQRV